MNLLEKNDARARLKAHLPKLSDREESEIKILNRTYPLLQGNAKIIAYVADQNIEVDLLPLVASCPLPRPAAFWEYHHSARWFFPKISDTDTMVFIRPMAWEKGKFGIWEPVGDEEISPSDADLILVPALGYAANGARLGRGGGYYDRVLGEKEIRRKTVGFTFSKFFPVPVQPEEHDVIVGKVITEVGIHTFLD